MVTPFSVSVSLPSTWMMAPLAVSSKLVPVAVTLSSVRVWLPSIVTSPWFRLAPAIVLEPVTSMSAALRLPEAASLNGVAGDADAVQGQRFVAVNLDDRAAGGIIEAGADHRDIVQRQGLAARDRHLAMIE